MATRYLLPLRENDFTGITLSESFPYPNIIVLFHNNEKESQQVYELLAGTVNNVVGAGFVAALNVVDNRNFMLNASMPSGADPYRNFRLQEIPHIMTYRNREPVGHYNGKLTSEMFANYILKVASDPGYYEPIAITAGTTVDNNYELPGKKPYLNTQDDPNRVARNSFELKEDIRGYDTKPGLVLKGSAAETQGLQTLQADMAQNDIVQNDIVQNGSNPTPIVNSVPDRGSSSSSGKSEKPVTNPAPVSAKTPSVSAKTPSVAPVLPTTNTLPK